MTLWFILFGLVVAVSFVLALRSMADFEENPQEKKDAYGLFLIRNPSALNLSLLDSIHEQILRKGLIISFERLIKGRESALVIFGPKEVLRHFSSTLNLLELEDYTQNPDDQIFAWEMGLKNPDKEVMIEDSFESFPSLEKDEQFWWQIVLLAKKDRGDKYFESQIRAVVLCSDDRRRNKLASILQNLYAGRLIKVPKPFTSLQIFEFYRKRSFFRTKNLKIKFPVLLPLLRLHLNRPHPKE